MTSQQRHNYKSDVEYFETFYERAQDGTLVKTTIPAEGVDISIIYRAGNDARFVAQRKAGVYIGCEKFDDSTLRVFIPLSRKSLGRGELVRELYLTIPDDHFIDKVKQICLPGKTGYYLYDGPSDEVTPTAQGEAIIATIIDSAYAAAQIGGFIGTKDEFYTALGNVGNNIDNTFVPQSRAVLDKGDIRIDTINDSSVPVGMDLYVGIQSYNRRGFHLIQSPITGTKSAVSNLVTTYLNEVGFRPLPKAQRATTGQISGIAKVLDLLDSEFVPMHIIEGNDVGYGTIRVDMQPDLTHCRRKLEMRFFCRRKYLGRYMGPLHNPLIFTLSAMPEKTPDTITVDRVTKGNKQVLRRIYKVGFVRPQKYKADGVTPDWNAGWYSSNWHSVLVERVIYLYGAEDKDNYVVKLI